MNPSKGKLLGNSRISDLGGDGTDQSLKSKKCLLKEKDLTNKLIGKNKNIPLIQQFALHNLCLLGNKLENALDPSTLPDPSDEEISQEILVPTPAAAVPESMKEEICILPAITFSSPTTTLPAVEPITMKTEVLLTREVLAAVQIEDKVATQKTNMEEHQSPVSKQEGRSGEGIENELQTAAKSDEYELKDTSSVNPRHIKLRPRDKEFTSGKKKTEEQIDRTELLRKKLDRKAQEIKEPDYIVGRTKETSFKEAKLTAKNSKNTFNRESQSHSNNLVETLRKSVKKSVIFETKREPSNRSENDPSVGGRQIRRLRKGKTEIRTPKKYFQPPTLKTPISQRKKDIKRLKTLKVNEVKSGKPSKTIGIVSRPTTRSGVQASVPQPIKANQNISSTKAIDNEKKDNLAIQNIHLRKEPMAKKQDVPITLANLDRAFQAGSRTSKQPSKSDSRSASSGKSSKSVNAKHKEGHNKMVTTKTYKKDKANGRRYIGSDSLTENITDIGVEDQLSNLGFEEFKNMKLKLKRENSKKASKTTNLLQPVDQQNITTQPVAIAPIATSIMGSKCFSAIKPRYPSDLPDEKNVYGNDEANKIRTVLPNSASKQPPIDAFRFEKLYFDDNPVQKGGVGYWIVYEREIEIPCLNKIISDTKLVSLSKLIKINQLNDFSFNRLTFHSLVCVAEFEKEILQESTRIARNEVFSVSGFLHSELEGRILREMAPSQKNKVYRCDVMNGMRMFLLYAQDITASVRILFDRLEEYEGKGTSLVWGGSSRS